MGSVKKRIKFWQQFKGTAIGKGAGQHVKRLERAYDRHRAKQRGGQVG